MVPQGDKVRAEKHCFLYHKTIKVSHTSNSLSQELLKKFQILMLVLDGPKEKF